MKTRVKFENVGGAKKSWTADLPDLSYRSLKKAVKDARAIGSRFPEFMIHDEKRTGVIFCGERACGVFTWIDLPEGMATKNAKGFVRPAEISRAPIGATHT